MKLIKHVFSNNFSKESQIEEERKYKERSR
jgi:hypothetical protein